MTGPTLTGFYFTFGLCLLTITLFNVYSAPFLWDEVSPSIPIICGYVPIRFFTHIVVMAASEAWKEYFSTLLDFEK